MTRRFAVLVLALSTCLAVGPCFSGDKIFKIGISQIVEHPALDSTRKGFMDFLEQHGYPAGKRVVYDYKNAQGNPIVSFQIARKFVEDKQDLILAISTPSAQHVAVVAKNIPILFAAVTDPVAAGLGTSPTRYISGTMDKFPVSKQLALIKRILPGIKRLGTVYNAGEANSVASVRDLKAAAARLGIDLVEASAATTSEVKMAAESLVGKVDAIHITTDNTVVQARESVVKVCIDNKIPLFAADVDSVARGAIAALGVDYYKLGFQTGAMAEKILDGTAGTHLVGALAVEYQKELLLYVNPGAAAKMGVKLPAEMEKEAAKIIK